MVNIIHSQSQLLLKRYKTGRLTRTHVKMLIRGSTYLPVEVQPVGEKTDRVRSVETAHGRRL